MFGNLEETFDDFVVVDDFLLDIGFECQASQTLGGPTTLIVVLAMKGRERKL